MPRNKPVLPLWPIGRAPALVDYKRDPSSGLPVPLPGLPPVKNPPIIPGPPRRKLLPVKGSGPFDVRAPIHGDQHAYPETPTPPELPRWAKFEIFLLATLKEYLAEDGEEVLPPDRRIESIAPLAWLSMQDVDELRAEFGAQYNSLGLTKEDLMKRVQAGPPVQFKTRAEEMLNEYLASAGIRYFKAHELTKHRWRGVPKARVLQGASSWWYGYEFFDPKLFPKGVWAILVEHVIPPPWLWPNIIPALRVLDRFRHFYGKPVTGISGYRLPWYNTSIKGSSNSFHMEFSAIDFTYSARKNGRLDTGLFVEWFERVYRRPGDGVGRYRAVPDFLHLDVGHNRQELPGKAENWWSPKADRAELKRLMP
jgi:hypothetical protein